VPALLEAAGVIAPVSRRRRKATEATAPTLRTSQKIDVRPMKVLIVSF